jgi:hypothetical protein
LATVSLSLFNKLKIAIAARLVGFGVSDNLSVLDLISFAGEELEEIKIKEVFLGKVADIQARQLVHALLSFLVFLLALPRIASLRIHVKVLELAEKIELLLDLCAIVAHLLLLRADLLWHSGEGTAHHHRRTLHHWECSLDGDTGHDHAWGETLNWLS